MTKKLVQWLKNKVRPDDLDLLDLRTDACFQDINSLYSRLKIIEKYLNIKIIRVNKYVYRVRRIK